jgi:hypothetical protein
MEIKRKFANEYRWSLFMRNDHISSVMRPDRLFVTFPDGRAHSNARVINCPFCDTDGEQRICDIIPDNRRAFAMLHRI